MLTKAKHSIPMGSQSKVNSVAEFQTWCEKNEVSEIHASIKGDGASAAAYYANGRLVQAISRGDGFVGEDITANALRFKGLPAWVETSGTAFNGAVRFEVILTVADWAKIDPTKSKNPRNAGTGIMGRKNGQQSDFLTIFAFDLDESINGKPVEFKTENDKTKRLLELGFNVMPHVSCANVDEAIAYFHEIARTRADLPIWIDGVVLKINDIQRQIELGISGGRPKGQVAWKFDSVGAETVLECVVVSGGHTGGLYPTAQLRPVEIGGTTVSNASLANYDEIERLDVAIGDSVWVVKANDIIPKIVRVTQRGANRINILQPTACPFCGGVVGRRVNVAGDTGVIIECQNPNCEKKSTGKIRRWIASVDILGIGDVVLEAMVEQLNLSDAADLYTLRARFDELTDLMLNAERDMRLGDKRSASILDAIEGRRELTLNQFLGSLGLDHLGKRRVEIMIKAANGELDQLGAWRSGMLRNLDFAAQVGVPGIGGEIQDGIDAMSVVIDKLLTNGVVILEKQLQSAAHENLQTICISGKLHSGKKKADYEESLKNVGYALLDEVSKGLNFLVLVDPDSTSSKAEKARKIGIQIISEDQLIELINSTPVVHSPVVNNPNKVAPKSVQAKVNTQPRKEIEMPSNEKLLSINSSTRRFEFIDDHSSKFWEIDVVAESVEVRFGKIGTKGQIKITDFEMPPEALAHAEKKINEKLKEGYVEVSPTVDHPSTLIVDDKS
jgi:DNA ligase (NAD+)